jgi:hypothetical protein
MFWVCFSADLLKRRISTSDAVVTTTLLSYPFVMAVLNRAHSARRGSTSAHQLLWNRADGWTWTDFSLGEQFDENSDNLGAGSLSLAGILGGMTAPPLLAGLIGQDVFVLTLAAKITCRR